MLDNTHQDWKNHAAALSFRGQAFINGKFVDAQSGKTFDSINPATGEVLAQVAECDEADVNAAVAAGRAAFEDGRWSRMAPGDRKAILLKLADLIRDNLMEMALLDSLDMGKLITDAVTVDAPGSAHFSSGTPRRLIRFTTRWPRPDRAIWRWSHACRWGWLVR